MVAGPSRMAGVGFLLIFGFWVSFLGSCLGQGGGGGCCTFHSRSVQNSITEVLTKRTTRHFLKKIPGGGGFHTRHLGGGGLRLPRALAQANSHENGHFGSLAPAITPISFLIFFTITTIFSFLKSYLFFENNLLFFELAVQNCMLFAFLLNRSFKLNKKTACFLGFWWVALSVHVEPPLPYGPLWGAQ